MQKYLMVRNQKMIPLKISIIKLERRFSIISSQHYGLQLLIISVPGDAIPSSEFHGRKAHTWCTNIYAGKMYL